MSAQDDAALGAFVRTTFPSLYLRLDLEERVVDLNHQTRAFLGPGALGAHFSALVTHFDAAVSPLALSRAEGAAPRALNFLTADGLPQTLVCAFSPLPSGVVVVGGADLAEQATLQRALLQSSHRLAVMTRESERARVELQRLNELKTRFMAMATHDLRAPLTALSLLANWLETEFAPTAGEVVAEDLASMRASAEFMQEIVAGFLDASLLDSGRLELQRTPTRLLDVIEASVRIAAPVAGKKGLVLKVEPTAAQDPVSADAVRLQQVVMNLLNNAIEHSPRGAVVTLSVQQAPGHAIIRVCDEAGGIAPDLQANLFQAYAHGASKTAGERSIGLGLAIARLIVEAHQGKIEVRSSSAGSTFDICVPRA